MKAKDIKPGVVYGYRSSKYGHLQAVVFLAPVDGNHLYHSASSSKPKGSPAFIKAREGSKPGRRGSTYSSPTTGYAAVRTSSPEAATHLRAITIEDFEEAASRATVSGIKDAEFTLITTLAHILGPYAELKAGEDAAKERKHAARRAEEEKDAADRNRLTNLRSALAGRGVKAIGRIEDGEPVIVLSAAEVDRLLALLDDKEA